MNWGKVNGILICAFLLINICLGLILSNENAKTKYEVTGNRLTELQVNLDRYHIAMYDFIPNYAPMQRLGLAKKDLDIEQIVYNVFENNSYIMETNNDIIIYSNGDESLTFNENPVDKEEYTYKNIIENINEIGNSETAIKTYANNLVKKIISNNNNMKLVLSTNDENSYEFNYMGYYEKTPIFGSYIRISIGMNGEVNATIKYLEIKGLIKEKHYLVEPEEMLYNVGERIKDGVTEQTIIMKIEIGYDAGIRKYEDMKQDYIEPYYRVELVNGKIFYINAYTNEIVN
ncbi:MAG: hypothetical protein K0R15_954 [Clostridiales bacterium]|jgi:hypothetical protein|nr:hypothetical protein [Clostridiales bacterium]